MRNNIIISFDSELVKKIDQLEMELKDYQHLYYKQIDENRELRSLNWQLSDNLSEKITESQNAYMENNVLRDKLEDATKEWKEYHRLFGLERKDTYDLNREVRALKKQIAELEKLILPFGTDCKLPGRL